MEKSATNVNQPTLHLVVPKNYRSVILKLAHKPGHLGRNATLAWLAENIFIDRE